MTGSVFMWYFVSIYCGFEGDEAATDAGFNARDHTVFRVTLSGDIDQDGLDNGNAYHVIRADFVDPSAIVDGATITGGYANGSNDEAFGGGILIVGGSQFGTAYDSQPKILRCRITGNFATSGGGVYIRTNETSDPEFRNCVFDDNESSGAGGAIECDAPGTQGGAFQLFLINCLLYGNTASGMGGAVHCDEFTFAKLQNCTVADNSSTGGGALTHDAAAVNPDPLYGHFEIYNSILWNNFNPGCRQATPLARSCPGRSAVRRSISTTHA